MNNAAYTLYIKNYRALYTPEDPIQIDIGDITLIVGPRGTGKSSILEALWLLPLLTESEDELLDFDENGAYMLNIENVQTEKPYLANRKFFTGESKIRLYNLVNQQSLLTNNKETNTIILLTKQKNNTVSYYGSHIWYKIPEIPPEKVKITKANNETLKMLNLEPEYYQETNNIGVQIHALTVNRIQPRKLLQTTVSYSDILATITEVGIGSRAENMGKILSASNNPSHPYYEVFRDIINQFIKFYNYVNEKERRPSIRDLMISYDTFTVLYEDGTRIPYENLSMGTRNLLTILMELAVTHTLKEKDIIKNDVIVEIEEPELALHASTLTALMEQIKQETKYIKFVFTSHSPRIILHISTFNDIKTKSYILSRDEESYIYEIGEEMAEKEVAALYPLLKEDLESLYKFYAKILEKYRVTK